MAQPTIRYRITSEVAGIDVADRRYRATRSALLPVSDIDAQVTSLSGAWTLWHDDRDGGSHTVGHVDAFELLEHAIVAAAEHDVDCHR